MALTSRRQLAEFGNKVATRVRRFISLFNRSRPLVVRIRTRCSGGKPNTVKPSARFVSAQAANLGCALRQPSIAKPSNRVALQGVVELKDVPDGVLNARQQRVKAQTAGQHPVF